MSAELRLAKPQPDLLQSAPEAAAVLPRLATLLRLVEGVWAIAVVADHQRVPSLIAQLPDQVAPVPLIERSLGRTTPDPLAIVRSLPRMQPAPIVCLTDLGRGFPDVCGYLDLQRETLARFPERLLLWTTPEECRYLAEHAPNFFSRLSGIFTLGAPLPAAPLPPLRQRTTDPAHRS